MPVYRAHSTASASDLVALFDEYQPERPRPAATQSKVSPTKVSPRSVGLFYHPLLVSREGFLDASVKTRARVEHLVRRILAAESGPELRRVVKMMDQLSDELCSVMDIAEFARLAHPDPKYRDTAFEAFKELYEFMNMLNTHVQLYEKVKRVMHTPEVANDFSAVERQVAIQFLRDFEKSGIHLPEAKRAEYVRISNRILELGHYFNHPPAPASPTESRYLRVRSLAQLDGLSGSVAQSLTRAAESGPLQIPIPSRLGELLVHTAHDESIRKEAFTLQSRTPVQQVEVLDQLLRERQALARLTGHATYAHLFLEDKMAQHPDHAQAFLGHLARGLQPGLEAELTRLREAKLTHSRPRLSDRVEAWDRDYCLRHARAQADAHAETEADADLHGYFTAGGALQGLSDLFHDLFGITLRPGTVAPGEVWHPDVRRMDVVDERGVHIGSIYGDLFRRPGKTFTGAAHFTVRCARRIDDDVVVGAVSTAFAPSQIRHDPATGRSYQRPVVVLVCNLEPVRPDTPSLLTLRDLETLFHEMGHAMHSMLALTPFHNVAGTRCQVDFVELPSILLERFAHDHRVVGRFARHYRTGNRLAPAALAAHLRRRLAFNALETNTQVLLSILDQCLHGPLGDDPARANLAGVLAYLEPAARARVDWAGLDRLAHASPPRLSSQVLKVLQDAGPPLSPVPYVDGVDWQATIGHLVGYGAGYYAYLLDRVLAARIWDRKFAADPLSREAGEVYRQRLLRWGGGRDPWQCVGEVLDDPVLLAGGREAMHEVGRWGLGGL
ncbi:Mitochondrial intermediate peptidase [Tieghemiomyces parasiticus]|uniref:mitochondrial intermediate peptidase n=1 Tax=Tieghemiomyces parasiticus TaxID=78921 RepID=A0A9W7ZP17_9FUNG|nr:Mitochondrial intermediate peptidase [Tieghemiomyces parasiticus]